jgi:tRNA A-37 threonylcarbamoyl transferase component Bud32
MAAKNETSTSSSLVHGMKVNIVKKLELMGINASVDNIRHLMNRSNSHTFICDLEGDGKRIFIKFTKGPHQFLDSRTVAEHQTNALKELYSINTETGRHLCPEVYPLMAEMGAVATEYIEGPVLTDYLLDPKITSQEKSEILEKAGKWITVIHDNYLAGRDLVPHEKILINLRGALNSAALHERGADAFKLLEESCRLLKDQKVKITKLHGDFNPNNLIVASNDVIGIDTSLRFTEASLRDIAYFNNQLDLLFYQPKYIWQRLFFFDRYQSAFLKGARDDQVADWDFALLWMRLASILMTWADFNSSKSGHLKSFYFNFIYNRIINTLAKEIRQRLRQ